MEIIITHRHMDIDGYASMLLAKKLFPKAIPLFSSDKSPYIKKIDALCKDHFEMFSSKKVIKKDDIIERIIVVDTKKAERLENFAQYIRHSIPEIIVFDHHPSTIKDIDASLSIYGAYGANTTLLWRYCKEKGIKLDKTEATIMLLGIYADTGNLTFPNTTPEDVEAVAEFLRMGADLKFAVSFLRPVYPDDLKSLFIELSLNPIYEYINDYKIVFYKKELDKDVKDLQLILENLSDIEGAHVVIGLFSRKGKKNSIFMQSDLDIVECNKILEVFGGGGHTSIGSAYTSNYNLDEIHAILLERLRETLKQELIVSDIMRKKIVIINDNTITINEAIKILKEEEIECLPIFDNDNLLGLITMKEIDKARNSNLGHAPVKAFMNKNLVIINENYTVYEAQKVILERDMSFLPVFNNENKIVGILSRKDILNYNLNKKK